MNSHVRIVSIASVRNDERLARAFHDRECGDVLALTSEMFDLLCTGISLMADGNVTKADVVVANMIALAASHLLKASDLAREGYFGPAFALVRLFTEYHIGAEYVHNDPSRAEAWTKKTGKVPQYGNMITHVANPADEEALKGFRSIMNELSHLSKKTFELVLNQDQSGEFKLLVGPDKDLRKFDVVHHMLLGGARELLGVARQRAKSSEDDWPNRCAAAEQRVERWFTWLETQFGMPEHLAPPSDQRNESR
jgi:hypothetical protein